MCCSSFQLLLFYFLFINIYAFGGGDGAIAIAADSAMEGGRQCKAIASFLFVTSSINYLINELFFFCCFASSIPP